jgi:hypothetical protein
MEWAGVVSASLCVWAGFLLAKNRLLLGWVAPVLSGSLCKVPPSARKKAIVGKSRVAATRFRRLSFVFLALAMTDTACFCGSPRQRIFGQIVWQTRWPPASK